MAAPTIPNGEEHFYPIIYEGNGAGQRVGKFVPFTDNGTIANSCIFNRFDSATMSRTLETPTNGKIWTFSTWYKRGNLDSNICKFLGYSASGGGGYMGIVSDKFYISDGIQSGSFTTTLAYHQNRSLEDTSKWYHFVVAVDTTLATASDRVKIYIDGERVTSFDSYTTHPAQDLVPNWNGGSGTLYIGRRGMDTTNLLDGYMAEMNFVDGTALGADTFGITDTSTGRWIPKTLSGITYGNSGWRLTFADSSNLGDDTSGNTNDFTVSNITSSDQTTDSPSQNFATGLGAYQTSYAMGMSEGNLKSAASGGSAQHGKSSTTLTFDANDSDGYYCEYTVNVTSSVGSNFNAVAITVDREAYSVPDASNGKVSGQVRYMEDGRFRTTNLAGTLTDIASWGSTWGDVSTPDVIGIFVKNNKIYFSKNGTWQNSANPNNETGGMDVKGTIGDNRVRFSHIGYQAGSTYGTMTANFGQKSFVHTPPTGYKTLNQDNLPSTDKGISDFLIIKNRDAADSWIWQDSLRGNREYGSPSTATQYNTAITDGVQKFLAGGFSTEDNDAINTSGESYVAYNFHLNGGTTTTDSSGTLSTELQANATAGFSVGKFTVSGSGNVTWAHGLGGVPEMGILCAYNSTNYGTTYHHKISTTPYSNGLFLINTDGAFTSSNIWGSAKPTSTLWTGLVGSLFSAGEPYIFYSFRGIEGFSKFGSYTGNGNSDGPFVYTGFRPAMVMVKSSSNAGTGWEIRDNKRSASGGSNPITQVLYPYLTSAEITTDNCDFLANGFKWRSSGGNRNESGYTYIYMAFAEHPFVGDGTNPVTAR